MRRCASEAGAAFGDGRVYVEQLLTRARHVEVQVTEHNAVLPCADGEQVSQKPGPWQPRCWTTPRGAGRRRAGPQPGPPVPGHCHGGIRDHPGGRHTRSEGPGRRRHQLGDHVRCLQTETDTGREFYGWNQAGPNRPARGPDGVRGFHEISDERAWRTSPPRSRWSSPSPADATHARTGSGRNARRPGTDTARACCHSPETRTARDPDDQFRDRCRSPQRGLRPVGRGCGRAEVEAEARSAVGQ